MCANTVALKKMMWWIFSAFLFVSMTLIQPNPLAEAKPADGDQCVEEGDGCLWNADDKNVTNCCKGLMCELAKTHYGCCYLVIHVRGEICLIDVRVLCRKLLQLVHWTFLKSFISMRCLYHS